MGNKIKIGLDFFPVDVNIFTDIKIKKLLRHKGTNALSVYIYVLCTIYKDSYFMTWDNESAYLISHEINCDEEFVKEVINYSLEISLFDNNMFQKNSILTSKGIQIRYEDICKRLKRRNQIKDFVLINSELIANSSESIKNGTSESIQNNSEYSGINKDKFGNNQIDSESIPIDSETIPTSKVKVKEKKIKGETSELIVGLENPRLSEEALRILTHDLEGAKKQFWQNRQAIYELRFSKIIIGTGGCENEYGGVVLKTAEFSKFLTNWCVDNEINARIATLFVVFCDINEKEYHHIEKNESAKFEALFAKFKNLFKDIIG